MKAVCLTTMGELWVDSGININAVDVASDGWVYLAGIEKGVGLIVMGYKDGELTWSKTFHESGFGAFEAIKYENGSVYVAGAISINFTSEDLTIPGDDILTAPAGKPVADAELKDKYPNFFGDPTYPIYVKLNAMDGALEQTHVLPSLEVKGVESLSSIQVDLYGNVYVAGGGWNPGPDPKDSFNNADFHWYTEKFSPAGDLLWKVDGERVEISPIDQHPYITKFQNLIIESNPSSGDPLVEFNSGLDYIPKEVSNWGRGWVYDRDGNIYVIAGQNYWDQIESDWGSQHGVVVKINAENHAVEWTKEFGLDSKSCLPNSMTFTPEGNLIISGISEGDVEGVKGLGGTDGFIIEMNPINGDINSVDIVGSEKNESISQIKFQNVTDADGNVLDHNMIIGGAFESQKYSIEGKSESDIYLISKAGFTLMGNELDNLIQGGEGGDSIYGGLGNDELKGGAGNDGLDGGVGADVLYAGDGNDTVDAGTGDDLIVGGDGAGDDIYKGGAGDDTVKYTSALAGIRVDLTKGTATSIDKNDASHIGHDTLKEVESVIAGYHNDALIGSAVANKLSGEAGDDVLQGVAGNDYLDGGDGVDTVVYSDKKNTVIATLKGNSESSIVIGSGKSAETDTVVNIENIIGGSAADSLKGDENDNVLTGGAGNDTLTGGAGNDSIDGGAGIDSMSGGAGDDIYVVDNAKDVIIESSNQGADEIQSSVTWTLGSNIEKLTLTGKSAINAAGNVLNNVVTGNASKNILLGAAGDDVIHGGAGDDMLNGGLGNDDLNGGIGNDTYLFDFKSDLVTSIDSIADAAGSDNVILTLGPLSSNTSSAQWLKITRSGAYGKDLVIGQITDTSISYTWNHKIIIADQYLSTNGYANTVESLVLTVPGFNAGKAMTYNTVAVLNETSGISGSAKADLLAGYGGGQSISGGEGNDFLVGGNSDLNADGTVEMQPNASGDVISGGNGDDLIAAGYGSDKLYGGVGNDVISAKGGDDQLFGGAGNDVLMGGSGADKFLFGFEKVYALDGKKNLDTISDFSVSEGDKIVLDKAVFKMLATGFTGEDLGPYLNFDSSSHKLYYDADGAGKGGAIAIAQLSGVAELHVSDFIIA